MNLTRRLIKNRKKERNSLVSLGSLRLVYSIFLLYCLFPSSPSDLFRGARHHYIHLNLHLHIAFRVNCHFFLSRIIMKLLNYWLILSYLNSFQQRPRTDL